MLCVTSTRLVSQILYQKAKIRVEIVLLCKTNLIMILILKEEFFSLSNCSECRKISWKWLKNVEYGCASQGIMKPKEATAYFWMCWNVLKCVRTF